MTYTVYVLYSEAFDKHYPGYPSDLNQRLISHNELGNEWTARYRPLKLICQKDFESITEDMECEEWLKSGIGIDFIKNPDH